MLTLLYYLMYTLVCAQAALCNIVVQHPPARAVAAAVDATGALHTILKVRTLQYACMQALLCNILRSDALTSIRIDGITLFYTKHAAAYVSTKLA
jgi:hypothetical protein